MGSALKSIGSTIGKIGGAASPLIGMLPGGSMINKGISMIGGLSGGQQMAAAGAAGLGAMGLMGGFKPQVGSTSNGATQTGNAFSNYLGGMMGNGNQSQMNTALMSMLNGRPGDPTSLQQYFGQGLGSSGQANLGQGSNAQFNPNQINVGFTPEKFMGQGVESNFGLMAPDVMQGIGGQANLDQVVNPAANVTALQALMQKQQTLDVANLRERFGNQGMSSGAALAEGNYLASALPQQALAVDQLTRQNNEQALQQRGQDLQNYLGSRGLDINQFGLGSNNAQFGSGQDFQAQQFNNQMGFNNAQMNNQYGLADANMDMQAQQLNNMFGQQAAAMNQGNQQFNIQSMLQNQGMGNQFNLGMQGIGAQLQGQNANAQANALAQLFGAFGNTQQLGTPQANTTVAPSWGSQVMGGVGAAADIWSKIQQAQNAAPSGQGAPAVPNMSMGGVTGMNTLPPLQMTPNMGSGMTGMPMPNVFTQPAMPQSMMPQMPTFSPQMPPMMQTPNMFRPPVQQFNPFLRGF